MFTGKQPPYLPEMLENPVVSMILTKEMDLEIGANQATKSALSALNEDILVTRPAASFGDM